MNIYIFVSGEFRRRHVIKQTKLRDRGAWESGATYVERDAVEHAGDRYIATSGVPAGQEPPTDLSTNAHWSGLVVIESVDSRTADSTVILADDAVVTADAA